MNRSKARENGNKVERTRAREGVTTIRGAEEGRRFREVQSILAIQLALDPAIFSIRYVQSLDLLDRTVPIQMFVAETGEGRVAFDIVDGRPERDLDEDGLLLLALQHHGIRLLEIDRATIESEPRASNCRKIWRHRDQRVAADLSEAIERAVAERSSPNIRELGRVVGLRHPMPTVCALICRKRLETDLGERPLDPFSVVRRPTWPVHAAFSIEAEGRNVKSTTVRDVEWGKTKR